MSKSPDAFRTISEVSEWLDVPAHVLRFWESKFTQVKPVKRAGGRRYYRPSDMALLSGIKQLLYDDGLTIRGVQKRLREDGVRAVSDLSQPLDIELDDAPEAPYTHVDLPDELPGETVPFTGRRVDVRRKKPEPEAPPTNGAAVERPSTNAPSPLTNEGAPAPEAPAQPPVTSESSHSDAASYAEAMVEPLTPEAQQPVASATPVGAPPETATPPAAEAPASLDGVPGSPAQDPSDAPPKPVPPQVEEPASAEQVPEPTFQTAPDPATAPEPPQGAAPAPVGHAAEAPTSPAPAVAATTTTTEPPQAEASVTAGPSDEAATPLDFGATEASATESPQRAEKPLTEERFDEAISSPAPPEVIPPTAAEPIQTEASVAHPANEATGTPALQTSNLEETAEPSQMDSVEATSTDESTAPPVSAEAPLTPTQTQSEAPTAAEASPTKPHSNETAASPEASVASASPQPEATSTEIARNEPEKPDSATTEPSIAADSAAGQSEPTAAEVPELQASTATDKTESLALGTTSPVAPEEAPGVSAATGNEPLAASAQPATEAPPEQSLQSVHDEASEVTIGSPDAASPTASGVPEPVSPEPEMVTESVDEEPLEPRPTEHATPSAAIDEGATPPEAREDEADGALESASLEPPVHEPSSSDPGVSLAASEPPIVRDSPSQDLPQTEIGAPPSGNGEIESPDIDTSAEVADAEAPLLEHTTDHSEPLPSAAEVDPALGTTPTQAEDPPFPPSGEPSLPAPEPAAEDLGFAGEPWQLRPEGQAIEAEAPEPERRVFGAQVPNDPPDVAASVLDGPTLAERIRALRSLPEGTDPAAVAALVARLRAVSDGIAATEPQPRDG